MKKRGTKEERKKRGNEEKRKLGDFFWWERQVMMVSAGKEKGNKLVRLSGCLFFAMGKMEIIPLLLVCFLGHIHVFRKKK